MKWIFKFYRTVLWPMTKAQCRFYPTCSNYSEQAIEKYGLLKGLMKSTIRLMKCQPFHPGGVDLV